eukprot:m.57007 g.57007  ORF g.57007 m.57007 type:complete len:133 (+) comp34676_c0_seq7:1883-2281(+)
MIDGRGSCCQGDNFMQTVYRQLGRFEPEDVIESARALKKDRRYVDPDRFGAWGWSYGGYLTSMVVASGSGEFKTAIAVAPVTSWKYYGMFTKQNPHQMSIHAFLCPQILCTRSATMVCPRRKTTVKRTRDTA